MTGLNDSNRLGRTSYKDPSRPKRPSKIPKHGGQFITSELVWAFLLNLILPWEYFDAVKANWVARLTDRIT